MFSLSPTKLERKKLYGWIELRATEPDGKICRQASLDSNGVTIIPKGAIKIGITNEDGLWVEKSSLVAVRSDGQKAEPIASSFDGEIELTEKATSEEFLDHIITSVYILSGDDTAEIAKWLGNDIYKFPFSYRGGFDFSDAFILSNGTSVFLFAGEKAEFEFIGLAEQAVLDETEEEETEETGDLDFGMF